MSRVRSPASTCTTGSLQPIDASAAAIAEAVSPCTRVSAGYGSPQFSAAPNNRGRERRSGPPRSISSRSSNAATQSRTNPSDRVAGTADLQIDVGFNSRGAQNRRHQIGTWAGVDHVRLEQLRGLQRLDDGQHLDGLGASTHDDQAAHPVVSVRPRTYRERSHTPPSASPHRVLIDKPSSTGHLLPKKKT